MNFFDKTLRAFDILGGQNAPLSSDGTGVQALCRCRLCHRIWLQDGKSVILDLSDEQVQDFARALNADLDRLPLFVCRICLWLHQGGVVSIDEYNQGESFGFCWEISHPVVIHAISAIQSKRGAERLDSQPDVPTQKEKLLAILRFLKDAPPPQHIHELPPFLGQMQAAARPPGFGQAGTEQWQWHGWSFLLPCPPLDNEQDSVVGFFLALHPAEQVLLTDAFRIWRFLLEITLLSGVVEGRL